MAVIRTSGTGKNPLVWFESSVLDPAVVIHGMFTRHGGVSNNSHRSLNLGFHVGDRSVHVRSNRRLLKEALGLRTLVSSSQTHGDRVIILEETAGDLELAGYDALITDRPGMGLMIQQADCQAVLLHDPGRGVVAAIHAGWRGSVANIIGKTIRTMQSAFRTRPGDLRAVISPSLGPCCAEFRNHCWELPPSFTRFQVDRNLFNFWEISRFQLRGAGLRDEHVDITEKCTMCSRDFFSHRRSGKNSSRVTGRNGSVIALRP